MMATGIVGRGMQGSLMEDELAQIQTRLAVHFTMHRQLTRVSKLPERLSTFLANFSVRYPAECDRQTQHLAADARLRPHLRRMRYVLDPKDVSGAHYRSETFVPDHLAVFVAEQRARQPVNLIRAEV